VPALNRYTSGSLVFFGIFAAMMLGVAYLFWSVKRNNRRKREAVQSESQG
jgi:Flp pilus assembly protein TadB